MVGQAMADATVKDSSGNPSPQKMMFDENDLPVAYDATKINEDDVTDYNICDMAEVMETLSKRYTETLFSSIVGSNKDALAQFEVWPRSKIDKGYVPQLKGLQKAIDNYRYARDIDEKTTRFDPMKATRDDVEDMKKKVMVLLRQIGEANNPLGLTRPVFDGIKESGLLKEQLETWIARKKNHCFLLYGPAGTGKTTFAGYLAQVLHYNVMQWSMSAAVNKWVGDTRKFITAAFGILGKLRNFVILIDEVDFVLTPQQGVTDTTKDLREAFMQHFNDFAAEAGRNGCIIVSTTNNIGLLDERTQQRLTGAEHKGGTTPIKIDFPRDRESLAKLVEYWAKDSNMTLLPDVGTFCKEWTDALFKVQNAATPKNLSIRNMSVMFMAWGRTLADRSNNVIEYIEQKVKSGQMPQEKAAEYYTITPDGERISGPATDLLAHGPSALVYLVENASVHKVKQSEQNPEGEEVDSAVLEKANEAERLLHEVDKSRVPEKGMPPPKSPKEELVVKPFGPKAPGAPPPAGAIMPPREMSPALSPAAPPPKDQPAGSPPSIAFNRKCVRRKNG
jgi:DNA polymerase III delta prime subunit